jgi:hypothetical protein
MKSFSESPPMAWVVSSNADVLVSFQVQVGVMVLIFGDTGDVVQKLDAGREILQLPFLFDLPAVAADRPPVELLRLLTRFFRRTGSDVPFARFAMLLLQLPGSGCWHDSISAGGIRYGSDFRPLQW